jgi:hypothetical protein
MTSRIEEKVFSTSLEINCPNDIICFVVALISIDTYILYRSPNAVSEYVF